MTKQEGERRQVRNYGTAFIPAKKTTRTFQHSSNHSLTENQEPKYAGKILVIFEFTKRTTSTPVTLGPSKKTAVKPTAP